MTVSVIIPTLNEESCLGETLTLLQLQRPLEVLVVDGGSSDGTCRLVEAAAEVATPPTSVRLLHGPRGRALQMNFGAAHASGDILVFLHADCSLEDGALEAAEQLLQQRHVSAGCFRMKVRAHGLLYRSIDWCASARVRLSGLAYGDQGLFVRRVCFERLGGFPPLRLMEDLFFSRTLKKNGRVVVAPRRIFVSPRRWNHVGVLRQTLRNWTLTALAAAGVHPDRLAEFYPVVR